MKGEDYNNRLVAQSLTAMSWMEIAAVQAEVTWEK